MRQCRQNSSALHGVLFLDPETADVTVYHLGENVRDMLILGNADHRVDLGVFICEFLTVALGQAARHDYILYRSLFLEGYKLVEPLDSLLLGGGDKAAGVQQYDIGHARLLYERVALRGEPRHHLLRVHLIFRAAERYHRDLYASHIIFSHYKSSSSL